MKKLNKKGFTLVELIVVIAIIGILAAVLVPSVTSYIAKAQKSSAQQNASNKYQEFVLALTDDCQSDVKDYIDATYAGYFLKSNGYTCLIVDGTVAATEKTFKEDDTSTDKVLVLKLDNDLTTKVNGVEVTIKKDAKFVVVPTVTDGKTACTLVTE